MTIVTNIRKPSIVVKLNGSTTLTDVLSVRTQHGFNLRVAEAQVTLRALPAGIQPWDEIEIRMDANTTPATTVRFVGYFVSADNQLYPKETILHCRGRLALAEVLEAEVNVDMSSYAYWLIYGGSYGHTDEVMVTTILYICRSALVPDPAPAAIGGTGKTLGTVSWGRGFGWDAGETGLSFIDRLDAVCLGYRTYDTFDGTITRKQISSIPASVPDFTFAEGVDIYRATETKSILEARNRIVVKGFPGWDSKTPITYTAEGGNPFLLEVGGSQWYMTQNIDSPMIEKELEADAGDGLSCEEVANWQLDELNCYAEKVVLTTPRADVIAPGDTIAVSAPIRLGVGNNFWVQEVDCEINRQNAFSQVLTCIRGVPMMLLMADGTYLVTEAGASIWAE